MPWPKKSKPKAERVVRAKQRDGTIKEYRYPAYKPEPLKRRTDTLAALVDAYKDSPEWRDMAPATRTTYSIYLRPLEKSGHVDPQSVRRRDILSLRDAVASASGNAAANYFVTASRQLWKWAIDRERAEMNPASRIEKLATGHLRAWTQEEASVAIAKLPEHLRRVVLVALYTGQRRGDLCSRSEEHTSELQSPC